jgi:hypothetical protein
MRCRTKEKTADGKISMLDPEDIGTDSTPSPQLALLHWNLLLLLEFGTPFDQRTHVGRWQWIRIYRSQNPALGTCIYIVVIRGNQTLLFPLGGNGFYRQSIDDFTGDETREEDERP